MSDTMIIVSNSGLDLKAHGTPDFPVGYLSPHLSDFPSACVKPHWHPEIEVIHAFEGGMRILVNHENLYLKAGDCIVFNKNAAQIQRLKNALNFIYEHYNEPITLDQMVAACYANKSEFCRLFKATLHQTPFDFLMHYRIQQSLPLLCRPELTITEIATTVGFSGASYYSEVFRKYISCSPTEYRKHILNGTQP